jgi:hypothetical protein
MAGWIEALRTGSWLSRERIRLVALMLLAASAIGAAYLLATSDGLNDRLGRPLGTDFSNVYAAGRFVLEGLPAAPYDPVQQLARERAMFGPATPFYGWHYPPLFLAVAALLALMPYLLALGVWQAVTLLLYLLAIRAIVLPSWPGWSRPSTSCGHTGDKDVDTRHKAGHDKLWLLLALAFPAVFINLGHGHNGFLTAALLAGALLQLDKRPALAGVLFGLLAYKPQFGLLVPLVLAASGRWRTFAAAALTVAVLSVAVTVMFGPEVWRAFLASTALTREIVLERGDTGWHKIQSVFSWVRMWGGGIGLAYAVQAAMSVAVAGTLIWLWRGTASFALKAAALLIGTVLATPYSLDYDLMLLAPAIAVLAADGLRHGFAPFEKTVLAALWLAPLVTRSVAETTLIPVATPLMALAFAMILRQSIGSDPPTQRPGPAPQAGR